MGHTVIVIKEEWSSLYDELGVDVVTYYADWAYINYFLLHVLCVLIK